MSVLATAPRFVVPGIEPPSSIIVRRRSGRTGVLKLGGSEMLSSTRESAGLDKLTDVTLEIREFVRQGPGTDSQLVADNLASLLQRVAGPSVREIDDLIAVLQTLRKKLQNDETSVKRAIAKYSTLSQSTQHSTKVISECLANWTNSRRPGRGTVGAD